MAMSPIGPAIEGFLVEHLGPKARYRTLLFQCRDIHSLDRLVRELASITATLWSQPRIIDYQDLFDDAGACSFRSLQRRVEECRQHPVILSGPLHFVDYWSDPTTSAFWRYLSGLSDGVGILVVDFFRSGEVEEQFRSIGVLPGADVQISRSRLELPV